VHLQFERIRWRFPASRNTRTRSTPFRPSRRTKKKNILIEVGTLCCCLNYANQADMTLRQFPCGKSPARHNATPSSNHGPHRGGEDPRDRGSNAPRRNWKRRPRPLSWFFAARQLLQNPVRPEQVAELHREISAISPRAPLPSGPPGSRLTVLAIFSCRPPACKFLRPGRQSAAPNLAMSGQSSKPTKEALS